MQNNLSIYGNNDGICNGNMPQNNKLGCISPTDNITKRQKIS